MTTTIPATQWVQSREIGEYSLVTPNNITDSSGTNLTDGSGTVITDGDSTFTPIASTTWLDDQGT